MFCPSCGAEYRDGILVCHECDVELVPKPRTPVDHPDLIRVFQTPDLGLLSVIKSLLDANEIAYVVQGEEGQHMLPLGPMGGVLRTPALGASVHVHPRDETAARDLINDVDTAAPAEEGSS